MNKLLKLYFANAALWIKGQPTSAKFAGPPDEVQALYEAMFASKKLLDELKNPNKTIDSISSLIDEKKEKSLNFQKVTGHKWPF